MEKSSVQKIAKYGFTLTELMTVVIIVSILMAIAAGSYRNAAERSHFSEGLVAAHAVMGAVERYRAENPTAIANPTFKQLDIELANQKECSPAVNYCRLSRYFEIHINAFSVTATRAGKYRLSVYPESFGGDNRLKPDECQGLGTNPSTAFCISLGYVNCNSSGVCTK